ncbi:MAG: hypothetical protein ABID35_03250, partial [Candidatus Margulisiibacteriota bacterium]
MPGLAGQKGEASELSNNQDTRYKQSSKIKMPKLDIGIWLLYLGNWSFASTVSGNELVENAKQYNGKLIEYEGEVIGDIMKRGDHAWL